MPAAQLDPVSPRPPRPVGWQRLIHRAPLLAYRAGLGDLLNRWGLLVLTTRGRSSGRSRYAVLTYRQHGRKTYVAVGWAGADWLHNLQADPLCLIQQGRRLFAARGYPLTDAGEIDRARRLFQRGTWAAPPDFAPLALVRFDPVAVAQPEAELTAERSAQLTADPAVQPSTKITAERVAALTAQSNTNTTAALIPLPVTTAAAPLLAGVGLAAAGLLAAAAQLRRLRPTEPAP